MLCEFFDPHPGLLGCTVPIPEAVKKVAAELDGHTLELEEAVAKIHAACPGGRIKVSQPEMQMTAPGQPAREKEGMVCLQLEEVRVDGREDLNGLLYKYNWRVIKFKEAE